MAGGLDQCPPVINLVKSQPDVERQYINNALRALARCIGAGLNIPDPTGHAGEYLSTDGTTIFWATISGSGTVTSVNASGGSTGLTFSGGPVTTSGTLTLAGTLAVTNGGTGATTANAALNNLLPSQVGNSTKVLTTDGSNASWQASSGGITSVVEGTGIQIDAADPSNPIINNSGLLSIFGVNVDNTNPQDPEILPADGSVNFSIGNPPLTVGAIIATGTYFFQLPANYVFTDWQLYVYPAATTSVDVRYQVFPTLPTAGNSITSGIPPSTVAATSNTGSTSGWSTVNVSRGNWIAFSVTANNVATFISLSVKGGKH